MVEQMDILANSSLMCKTYSGFLGSFLPRTHGQAFEIDLAIGKSKWKNYKAVEMEQLSGYKTFVDKGKDGTAPIGYEKICCHMVYEVKHDGPHKG
jgi:hypothetical protein